MNHGGVVEVDADADAKMLSRASAKPGQPSRAGESSLIAGSGGVVGRQDGENSPLLQSPLDGRDAPWEEEEQFKGRPWYRKPSVS